MASLGNPKNTIDIVKKYNFAFQKKYGQNFLIDPHVLEKIVRAADIGRDDYVLEIGPGIGTLTQYLCEKAGRVTAVEIDRDLIPILDETLAPYENVEILNSDILKLDLRELIKERSEEKTVKVVANLPYYITTPIIMGIFESGAPVESLTVMVQKEVAERMQAGPGTKDYGALSLAVQYYSKPYVAAHVPPNCFMPRPKVGSTVIRLDRFKKPPVEVREEGLLFTLIRASFNQRRKTLVNSLYHSAGLGITKESIAGFVTGAGLSVKIRGEALTLKQFAGLSNLISQGLPDTVKQEKDSI